MPEHLPRLRRFADSIREAGFTDVILFGMGGSSLAAEVLRAVFGVAPGHPGFQVLDSVDPDAVRRSLARPASSLFVVASKSGSTVEVASLAAEADFRVRAAGVANPELHFVAITDEHTTLHRLAMERGYREVFVNPADIGGRYSALSLFGLVPAALMGIDLVALMASALEMARACRTSTVRRNPGLALGAFMAAGAAAGRDKLTLALPPPLERLGLWIEQLVAESTGKQGTGIVPVAGEYPSDVPGDDRIIVSTAMDGADPSLSPEHARTGGSPAAMLRMPDATSLGAEFFRWEVATATAGFLLNVNPFDEPNVQQAKDATRGLLEAFTADGRLPSTRADAETDGAQVRLSVSARAALQDADPLAILTLLRPAEYFALLAYLPPDDDEFSVVLRDLRDGVSAKRSCAATLGYGPRYLHSTGQLHKGGPDTGVFVIVTAEPAADLPVPGQAYSFGVLEMAQAAGDFASLDRIGRRALHLHLPGRSAALLRAIGERLLDLA